MIVALNLSFLEKIKSTDLLTYLALLLAYGAYTWTINRDLKSWKSLFVSFQADLDYASEWLKNEYLGDTYKDKTSFSPRKIIYPLSFESLPEIIRRGVAEFPWISKEYIKNLSLFNERVAAFNSLLEQVRKVVSANPVSTEKLNDLLADLGCLNNDENPEFDDFKKTVRESKSQNDIFYLAENIRRLNRVIHVNLIGDKNKKDGLHFLYVEIEKKLEIILENFDKRKPFFIRYRWILIGLSVPLFILVEIFLK